VQVKPSSHPQSMPCDLEMSTKSLRIDQHSLVPFDGDDDDDGLGEEHDGDDDDSDDDLKHMKRTNLKRRMVSNVHEHVVGTNGDILQTLEKDFDHVCHG